MQPTDANKTDDITTNDKTEDKATKPKPKNRSDRFPGFPGMAGRYRRRGHPDIARWKREGKTITTLGTMGDVVKALGGDSDGEEE